LMIAFFYESVSFLFVLFCIFSTQNIYMDS